MCKSEIVYHHNYNGKISESYSCIKNILARYVDSPFIVASVDKNYAFRGNADKELRTAIYSDGQYNEEYDKMLKQNFSFYRARIGVEEIQEKDMLFHLIKEGLLIHKDLVLRVYHVCIYLLPHLVHGLK